MAALATKRRRYPLTRQPAPSAALQSVGASCGICTKTKVTLRTRGNTTSSVGNAITHDRPQEPSHNETTPGAIPALRKVLTIEMTPVMMMDRKNGITTAE